jgi:hypothetical protein
MRGRADAIAMIDRRRPCAYVVGTMTGSLSGTAATGARDLETNGA